uniref:Uncharacterized protein n=1 Tax=Rhabditophanes sp. KR3021 TaxID=114890 RepID=A0AC35U3Q1_9BILA
MTKLTIVSLILIISLLQVVLAAPQYGRLPDGPHNNFGRYNYGQPRHDHYRNYGRFDRNRFGGQDSGYGRRNYLPRGGNPTLSKTIITKTITTIDH